MNTCFASPDQNGQLDLLNLPVPVLAEPCHSLSKDTVTRKAEARESTTTKPAVLSEQDSRGGQSFDGSTYIPEHDQARLGAQLQRVFNVARNGDWLTLDEICAQTGDHTQAVSARLRDLRKAKFGGHTVDRRRRGAPALGIFEYRLVLHT